MERFNILVISIIALVIFFLIAIFLPGPGYSDYVFVVISVASILFSIQIAFSIATNQSKLSQINEILKYDEGIWLFIYQLSLNYDEQSQLEVKNLIDSYYMEQIDYLLKDFRLTNDSFFKLFRYIEKLHPHTKVQEATYGEMINLLGESTKNRKQVEALVSQSMSKFEWFSILGLLFVLILLLFYINTQSLISIISTVFLSMSALVLVLILRDLDNLRWREESWNWQPLENLFYDLGLLPYYPKVILDAGRIKLKKGQKIRIAEYPNPYPDMSGKVIKEIEV